MRSVAMNSDPHLAQPWLGWIPIGIHPAMMTLPSSARRWTFSLG
jgi:hypothetical protein